MIRKIYAVWLVRIFTTAQHTHIHTHTCVHSLLTCQLHQGLRSQDHWEWMMEYCGGDLVISQGWQWWYRVTYEVLPPDPSNPVHLLAIRKEVLKHNMVTYGTNTNSKPTVYQWGEVMNYYAWDLLAYYNGVMVIKIEMTAAEIHWHTNLYVLTSCQADFNPCVFRQHLSNRVYLHNPIIDACTSYQLTRW